jgi:NADH-quinone oxidoreductase subunit A
LVQIQQCSIFRRLDCKMFHLLTFIIVAIVLTCIILIAAYAINAPSSDFEKVSAYECGFEPFGDARSFFDIHFYIVGLLFIIFDLEIVFLVPLAIGVESMSAVSYLSFLAFMGVLLIGFYYEWSLGLLSWVSPSNDNRPLGFLVLLLASVLDVEFSEITEVPKMKLAKSM